MGADIIASDSTHASKPVYTGLLSRGKILITTAKQPDSPPENPRPVTALPTMNMGDEAAVAQSREPTRNIALLIKKTILIEKNLYNFAKPN
jgi:hypothetical protein